MQCVLTALNQCGVDLKPSKWLIGFKPADAVLIITILCFSMISAMSFWSKKDRKAVFIYKNDRLWGEYPINEDRIVQIDAHNRIMISDGRVAMIEADCPDHRCVKQGFSSKLPIICMPNRVMIEIKESEQEAPHVLY